MKPLTLHQPEHQMIRALWMGNLVTFGVLLAGAFMLAPVGSAVSVAVGGIIALANFSLLQRAVSRAIQPQHAAKSAVVGQALVKYYLRFIATAAVIFILVSQGLVEPLGLMVGLSVVVVSIFIWGAREARKLYKEAD